VCTPSDIFIKIIRREHRECFKEVKNLVDASFFILFYFWLEFFNQVGIFLGFVKIESEEQV